MTVAELIAELSNLDPNMNVMTHSDVEPGGSPVEWVDVVTEPIPFGPTTPYVRLW